MKKHVIIAVVLLVAGLVGFLLTGGGLDGVPLFVQTGGPGNENPDVFPGDIHVKKTIKGDSPVKLEEGLELLDANGEPMFRLYVKGRGEGGPNVPGDFNNTLIIETSLILNPSNMEIAFFDSENQRPALVINEGAALRATTLDRSFQVGKNNVTGPVDGNYTLIEGYKYIDANSTGTGADLAVEDGIESKGGLFTQGDMIVDGDANFGGMLTGGMLGEIRMFALSEANSITKSQLLAAGWAVCDGNTPASQGIADPAIITTPDLQQRFIRMSEDQSSGATGGEAEHILDINEIPAHLHEIDTSSEAGSTGIRRGATDGFMADSELTGGGQAHNNLPPYYELVFFIKVK